MRRKLRRIQELLEEEDGVGTDRCIQHRTIDKEIVI
jgi:hypothetical protein